jgi:hypothetical protein
MARVEDVPMNIHACSHRFQHAVVFIDGKEVERIDSGFELGVIRDEALQYIHETYGTDVSIIPGEYSKDFLNLS